MKSFFSRLHDTQTGHSKSASRDSYKFWIPNADPDRDAAKPPQASVPTTREKRSSSRAPKPLQPLPYDKPTPNMAAAGPSTEHATYPIERPTPLVSSTQHPPVYSHAPAKATSTRHRDYDDGKPQPPPRTPSRPSYSTRAYLPPEVPLKSTRHGNLRAEATAAVQRVPANLPSTSKQSEEQLPNQEGKEPLERYHSRNDQKVESGKRERERDRPKEREQDRGREREETTRHPTKDRTQEKVIREWERDRERHRTRNQDREREQEKQKDRDRGKEGGRGRDPAREPEREQQRKEREREPQKQQLDKERELEQERQLREKEREREQESRQLEKERQREQERLQLEKARQREQERQQLEKERQREQERQQLEKERQREQEKLQLEKERQREQEKLQLEKERQREQEKLQLEKERQREQEKLLLEKERQREQEKLQLEKERQREQESLRLEKERQREQERLRLEKERQREQERLRLEKERQHEQERLQLEKERQREQERLRLEKERQQEQERFRLEKERQHEQERLRLEKERQQEQERFRLEKERQHEQERLRLEKERQQEQERFRLEKERQHEQERLQLEKERQREQERLQHEKDRQHEQERQLLEKERLREQEKQLREKEHQREQERLTLEQERQREQERQLRENEREREREQQMQQLEKERERDKEKEREKYREQREREREKERTRYHERERREREKERERDKHLIMDRDHEREKEREKGNERPSGVTKGSPNTRGKERTREVDAAALDDVNKIGQPDRALADATRTDLRNQEQDFRKERDGRRVRDTYKSRERDRDQFKYRAEATDGEQDLRRSKPRTQDRDRRREANPGWMSDNFAAHERKSSRQVINQEPIQLDEGESSDNSLKAIVGPRPLQRRNRIDDIGSSAKLRSTQDRPSENTDLMKPLASSDHSQIKVLPGTSDAQPQVGPTPLRMPVHLPPRESRTADRLLHQTANAESENEPEAPMRREINRLKLNNRQDDPPQQLPDFHPNHVEPTLFPHRRPPSRASVLHILPALQVVASQTPRIGPTFLPQTSIIPQTPRIGSTSLPQTKYVQPPNMTSHVVPGLIPESVRDTNPSHSRSNWAKDQRSYIERPFEVQSGDSNLEHTPINPAPIPDTKVWDRNLKLIQTTPSVAFNSVSRIDTQFQSQEPPYPHPNANVAVFLTTIDPSSQSFSQQHAIQSKDQGGMVHHDTIRTALEPLSQARPVPVSSDIRQPSSRQRDPSALLATPVKDMHRDIQFLAEPDDTRPSSRAQHFTPLMQPTTIKPLESTSQTYAGLSIKRPPTASGFRDASRQYVPDPMSLPSLSTEIPESLPTFSHPEGKAKLVDPSNTGRPSSRQSPWTGLVQNRTETPVPYLAPNPTDYLFPRIASSDSQSKVPESSVQERVGMLISRSPTSASSRQDNATALFPPDRQFNAVDENNQEGTGMSISRPSSNVGFRQGNGNSSVLPSDGQPKVLDRNIQERIGVPTAVPFGFRQNNANALTPWDSQSKVLGSSGQQPFGSSSLPRPSSNVDFKQDSVKPTRHHGPSNTHSNVLPMSFQGSTAVKSSSSHGPSNRTNGDREHGSSQHMDVLSVDPGKVVFQDTGGADAASRPIAPVQMRTSMRLSNQQSSQSTGIERESSRAQDRAIDVSFDPTYGTSTLQVSTPSFSKQEIPRVAQHSFATVAPQLVLPEHSAHHSTRGSKSPRISESRPTASPSTATSIPINVEGESAVNPNLGLENLDKQEEKWSSGTVADNHDAADLKQAVVPKFLESGQMSGVFVPQMKIYKTLTAIVPQYDPEVPSDHVSGVSGLVSSPIIESLPHRLPLPVSSSKSGWGVPQNIQMTPSSAENLKPEPSHRHKPDGSSTRRSEPKNLPPEEEEGARQPPREYQPNSAKPSVQFDSGFRHHISDPPVDKEALSLGFFTTTFSSALNASMDKKPLVENPPVKKDANERTNGESLTSRSYVASRDGFNEQVTTVTAVEPQLGLLNAQEPKNPRTDEDQVDLLRPYKKPVPPSPNLRKEFEVNRPLNTPLVPSHPPKISHPILAEILSSPPPKTFTNIHAELVVPPSIMSEPNRLGSSSNANADVDPQNPRNVVLGQMNTDTFRPSTSRRLASESHPQVALEELHALSQAAPPFMPLTVQATQPTAHGRDAYSSRLSTPLPASRAPSSSNQPEREQMNTDTSRPLIPQRYFSDSHTKVTLERVHRPPRNAPPAQDNHTPPSKVSDIQPSQTVAQGKNGNAMYPSTVSPPSRVPSASNQPPVAVYPTLVKQDGLSTDVIRPSNVAVRSAFDATQAPSSSQDRQPHVLYAAPNTQPSSEHHGVTPEGYSVQKTPSQAFLNPQSAPLAQTLSTASSNQVNRHRHSASLPTFLVPPPTTNPLTTKDDFSRSRSPAHHQSQFMPFQTELVRVHPTREKTTVSIPQAPSEETILMTPSSLAQSMMLKPTVSRQSVTPSVSSQTAKKAGGILNMFRKTPVQPQQYEIWHPNVASKTPDSSPGHSKAIHTPPGLQREPPSPHSRRVDAAAEFSIPVPIHGREEQKASHSHVFTPFRYLTTKRNRAVSVASMEAQDGTAPNTVVGSPTASMHSQAPIQPPPLRDPWLATKEWRNKEEADAKVRAKARLRRQRPGVVFDVSEDQPEESQKRPRRTRTRYRSSSKQAEMPQT